MISEKKLKYTFLFIAIILIAISGWLGGKERWALSGIDFGADSKSPATKVLEEKLKEDPESPILQYNHANILHRHGDLTQSREILDTVLNSKEVDNELTHKSLYNLGNNLFRQAEKEKDLNKALELMQESLLYYRDLIVREKKIRERSYMEEEKDKDLHFNYAVVAKRIKLLKDQIKKQQKEQEKKKDLYTLLKELLDQEKEIKESLKNLNTIQDPDEREKRRDQLLTTRQKGKEKLAMIRQKVMEQFQAPSAAPNQPLPGPQGAPSSTAPQVMSPSTGAI